MNNTRNFKFLGWWILLGFFGTATNLVLLGTQFFSGKPISLGYIYAILPCTALMLVGKRSVIDREAKSLIVEYRLLGYFLIFSQKPVLFDSVFLALRRRYSNGERLTYCTGVVGQDNRHFEVDWQNLTFPSEVPNEVLDFLKWLNLPILTEGDYDKYASEQVKLEVGKFARA